MKKKIPLEVIQKIQPLIEKYPDVISPIIDATLSFKFIDSEPDSGFYFLMHHRNDTGKHRIKFLPASTASTKSHSVEVTVDDVAAYFDKWINIVDTYNKTRFIYDDHAQKTYQKYYYEELKIVDDNADYAPFDPPRVFFLEEHLEAVKDFVDTNVASFKDPEVAESIKASCDELIGELTSSSQNAVMKKLTGIWAKISKSGTTLMKSFLKDFWADFKKKLIEKGVEKITTYLAEHSDDIADIAANVIP